MYLYVIYIVVQGFPDWGKRDGGKNVTGLLQFGLVPRRMLQSREPAATNPVRLRPPSQAGIGFGLIQALRAFRHAVLRTQQVYKH